MRILITGPESTGKSTLAIQLASELAIPAFPEYARTYLEENGPEYTQSDLLTIARDHHRLVHTFPTDQPLILDTYLINIKIWSEDKYGVSDPWLQQALYQMNLDMVLLTYPDLPWQQDSLRENESRAMHFFQCFQQELAALNLDSCIIKGQGQARLAAALKCLNGK